jgi:hypothetical protein
MKTTTRTTTQTVCINGVRTKLTTRNGKVTATAVPPLEWELQAAQCRQFRNMPEYVTRAEDVRPGTFTFAGDQNSAKRGPKARMEALAAGLMSGEHDVRLYMWPEWSDAGGVLGLIENKVGRARLEPSQETRHPLLAALGFKLQAVVRATTCEDAAAQAVALVRGWLVANGNAATTTAASTAKTACK